MAAAAVLVHGEEHRPPGAVWIGRTGGELVQCADGQHTADPTGESPALTGITQRVMDDYPGYLVTVHFGFRAVLCGPLTPVHVEATTEAELRSGIARQIRSRELAARDAQPRETTQ